MKKAEVPKPVVSGSGVASASLIAGIAHSKYTMAMPLYRQEQEFNRLGYKISRQTMANWLIYAYEHYLKAVVSSMKEKLLEHTVLHADETTVQVLHEDEKAPQSKSYMWLFRTSGDSKTPMAIYEYQPDRKHCRPAEFLENWSGFLHCDGYEAYHKLPGVTPVGCLAHVRRKFFEAKMALHPDKRETSLADKGLKYCDKLFKLEKKFAYYSPENNFKARFEGRQKESKPLFDEFFVWAESLNALPQTAIGKAVSYALNEKKYVENYLSDGRLEISNNRAERSIKPFVIGRKNWLFSDSVRGANTSAAFYSLIISATENGLNPMKYLAFLLDTAANSDLSVPANIENLLPWNAPDSCKLPKSKPENFPWEEDDEIAKIRRGKEAAE
jgi:transposase